MTTEQRKLQETVELCPNCKRRDVLSVYALFVDGRSDGETWIACEVCYYDERTA